MKHQRLFLISFGFVLLATACGGPRKACRKAEGMLAKAVLKCPELLENRTTHDTITVVVPGKAGAGERGYTQAHMDSLARLCSELLARAQDRSTARGKELHALQTAEPVVQRIREEVCRFDAITVADSSLMLKIWSEGGKVRYWYYVLPQVRKQVVSTTHPQVVAKQCPPPGVASWYRTAFWWLAVFLLLGFGTVVWLFANVIMRGNKPEDQG